MVAAACFNPRAPCGARPFARAMLLRGYRFQSTRPMRGATMRRSSKHEIQGVSIHAPHAGRDSLRRWMRLSAKRFNPRAPCGARLRFFLPTPAPMQFQSTRPVWGATGCQREFDVRVTVSIHAPRVGRDRCRSCNNGRSRVSIHAPRVGRDMQAIAAGRFADAVSIHAPRVGRDSDPLSWVHPASVSIHAPHAGRDA